jgi:pimeloyl-ACP methyl ester carboxylesterase
MSIEPFSLPYEASAVDDLRQRLKQTRWPDSIVGSGWDYGTDLEFMHDLCDNWQNEFDWKQQLEKLSGLHHFRYMADGVGIHFVHERGKGVNPIPLVLTHGWPGSFLEMMKILPMLTDPVSHGGDANDSFDVVIPSLPGFGFSDRPTHRGMNTFRIAESWDGLMQEAGYSTYAVQGGDFGANVSTVMALRYPERVSGLHLNYIPGSYKPHLDTGEKLTDREEQFLKEADRWHEESGAYWHVQSVEPQTVSFALNDSPVGLAAWLIEKFRDWADCDGDLWRRFTRDEVLTQITLYWMTQTIHSSCRLYYESFRAPLHFRKEDLVKIPTAVARFPKEEPFPPREWAERGYNVQSWTEMPRGGHFAAMEEPELLVEDIRQFFRDFR